MTAHDAIATVRLVCHPETPTDAVSGIEVRASRGRDGTLQAAYRLEGHLGRIRLPPVRVPATADHLWQHTCFELFVRRRGDASYHELNFAPSGEWAAYSFSDYRHNQARLGSPLAPRISIRKAAGELELGATFNVNRLSSTYGRSPLSLAFSTVVEELSGVISYWALVHPPGKPDFHHSEAFAVELA